MKSRVALLMFLFFPFPPNVEASFNHMPVGARPVGMGLAFVAVADDPYAAAYNPAGLAFLNGAQLTTFYSRPFGLKELETTFLAGSFSRKRFAFGAAIQQFGFSKYRERMAVVAFAGRFGKRFAFGGSLFYAHLRISGYGDDGCPGLNLGYLFRFSKRWAFAGSVLNAARATLRRGKEALPQELNAGLRFLPAPNLLFSFQASRESGSPVSFRSGIEWKFLKQMVLRSGCMTAPARFTLGFGVILGRIQLDYAWASHVLLGSTHQISVTVKSGLVFN